jgi:tetratricopeptide (TPR) repeat protein
MASDSDLLLDDLKSHIANRDVLVVVGAGVSIGATNRDPVASWMGLLEHGIGRCKAVASMSEEWVARRNADLTSGDMDDLLSVAELVASKLGSPRGGEYGRWLRETVGALRVVHRGVLEALRDLDLTIATTNYDGLIEEVTGRPAVTWQDGAKVERVLRGDDTGVLHLHGYWERPETVILGVRDYQKVLGDAHAQTMQRAIRATRTLLFVGYGAGLKDPNFGAFLKWTRGVFPESEYRHYRLALEADIMSLQAEHPREERVFVLSYGPSHADLASFLRGLAARSKPAAPAPVSTTPRLPAVGYCFGRDELVAVLVATMLQDRPPPTAILGGPGHGKTTVSLKALQDPRVGERFGARRYFARCDGTKTRDALAAEIALAMGLEAGPNLEARAFTELERDGAVLMLDNLETPWEADPLGTEELLAQLAAIPILCLVTSVRGMQRPQGVAWREPIGIPPLDLPAARQTFLAIAGERFRTDPRLDGLINAVGAIPLAISLLAYQAEGQPDLAGIWDRWQSERTKMLQRGGGGTRLTNLELSLELSVNGPRMNDPARQLLSLLGVLPDGIAWQDLDTLVPGQGAGAAADLRRVGLAVDDEANRRLRVLAPVREFVLARHVPGDTPFSHTIEHYLALAAEEGSKVGRDGGAESIVRLAPEFNNLEAMILAGLSRIDLGKCVDAARGMGEFIRFTGLGAPSVLERAGAVARSTNDARNEANCIRSLGDIALQRSDHDGARRRYDVALPLFRKVGDVPGEAHCIARLGDIALQRSDHDEARRRYDSALPLFCTVGDVRGEANCIQSLGDIALTRSDHDEARRQYDKALKLYGKIPEPYSIGGTHRQLARISPDQDQRRRHVEAAREAWASIKRDDLVEEARREFGEGVV